METLHDLTSPGLKTYGKSSSASSNDNRRITQIDGLRGIAILLVISFHYINNQLWYAQSLLGRLICKATSFGWVGVDLFFVLSGFLIGNILIKNRGAKNYFSTFYIRRVVRIIPNYFLAVSVFLIICAIPFFSDNRFLTGDNVIPWWSYYIMVHNNYMAAMNTMGNSANSITWSIGVEEQFYIIFPFIVYFVKDKWLPMLLFLVIVAACIFRMQFKTWVPTYVLLPSRMDSIAFGFLVAYYYQNKNFKSVFQKYSKFFIGIIMLDVLVCAFLYWRFSDLGAIKHSLFALSFAIGLGFALSDKDSLYGRLLQNKLLTWFGTISYSLYLFHYVILGLFHHFANNKDGLVIANGRDVILTIAALITSLILSWTIFKFLETPFVNWGKRFKY
jgi:peptidoglycan/LPS O-acetylase OafA/YrhL